jgi:hypothetical protein
VLNLLLNHWSQTPQNITMKKLLLLFFICSIAALRAFSQDDVYYTGDETTVTVKAETAPPALPTYTQPPCPNDGYMWTPGYWAWAPAGYYWVPGVWVAPPRYGLLWTPGYWGFYHGYYGWHDGYWGENIGYYGGVYYGYGYGGSGFYGGRWAGNSFQYNTAVWSVNTTVVHNTYVSNQGISNNQVSTASYNGPGGVKAQPTANEQATMGQPHVAPTSQQQSHQVAASNDKSAFATANHGKPATAAMATPNGQRFSAEGHATTPAASTNHQPEGAGNGKAASTQPNKPQQPVNNNNQHNNNNNKVHAQPQHSAPPAHNSGGGGKKGK